MDKGRRAFLLGRSAAARPGPLLATIGDACLAHRGVTCRTCGEHCDAGAIAFPPRLGGVAQPRLVAAACTGCGNCTAACPVGAIALLPALAPESTEP